MKRPAWLNRTVIGAGLTSFLADIGYEMACSLIPGFLLLIGLPGDKAAAILGAIEAVAEFVSNGAKLIVGWWSDRIGRRKLFVVAGYSLTGSAFVLIALGGTWPFVMLAKSIAWLGKGIRGPLRNAILSDSIDPAHRGKAFGFHRAGDTLGAVLGPLLAAVCLLTLPRDFFGGLSEAYRLSFWLTLIPGLAAAAVFAILIREIRFTPKPGLRLGASLSAMPKTYRRFLVGVALFGIGDFSHLMLIGLAMTSTSNAPLLASWFGPDESNPMARLDTFVPIVPLLLYSWRNLIQALAAFPAGWLGDRIGHRRVLTIGYGLGTATMLGFLLVVLIEPLRESLPLWCLLFALAGIYMAVQETLEPAIVPELVPDRQVQGTAFGVLAAVNGYGDVVASLTVGLTVYWFGWTAALIYAAALMLTGTIWITATRPPSAPR